MEIRVLTHDDAKLYLGFKIYGIKGNSLKVKDTYYTFV